MVRYFSSVLVLTLLWVGCANTDSFNTNDTLPDFGQLDGRADVLKGLAALRVEPPNLVVETDGSKVFKRRYRAFGRFEDGTEREVTPFVAFKLEDVSVGVFKGSELTLALNRGGKTNVVVEADEVVGATPLTVNYRRIYLVQGVPGDARQRFDGAKDAPGRAPTLVYPPDGVLIPPNLVGLEFQWTKGSGNDVFELSIASGRTEVRIYTKCYPVGAGCALKPVADMWSAVSTAFRGRDGVKVVVRGSDAAALAQAGASAAHRLAISEEDVRGGLFYWAATPGTIVRYDFGRANQQAKPFYTKEQGKAFVCVGCHAMARNGKQMAVGLDMPAPAGLRVVDVATRADISSGAANFMAFSPDGELFLTSDGVHTTLRDPKTLEPIGNDPLWVNATMPDWSPNQELVAYVAHDGVGIPLPIPLPFGSPGVKGATQLMLMGYNAATRAWKGPLTLVKKMGAVQYYPTFSPDSAWIAFNRSSETSYDAADASLWIVRADGQSQPHELKAANRAANLSNSWPKFSPFMHSYRGRKLMWLTFSSKRAYGLRVNTKPGQPLSERRAQIWMAAIDPSEMVTDPSYPAFWLPFQDLNTSNHIAQWTAEVIRKECGIDRACPEGEECKADGYCDAK